MAKKNIAKKATKSNNLSVWATVDRETNKVTQFAHSRSVARDMCGDNETVRGFNLVPKK